MPKLIDNLGKQLDEVTENLKKNTDNVLDNAQKLKLAKEMWKELTYQQLLDGKPPCFLAGTIVKTENGLEPIENIKQGTKVLSYNFETDKTE